MLDFEDLTIIWKYHYPHFESDNEVVRPGEAVEQLGPKPSLPFDFQHLSIIEGLYLATGLLASFEHLGKGSRETNYRQTELNDCAEEDLQPNWEHERLLHHMLRYLSIDDTGVMRCFFGSCRGTLVWSGRHLWLTAIRGHFIHHLRQSCADLGSKSALEHGLKTTTTMLRNCIGQGRFWEIQRTRREASGTKLLRSNWQIETANDPLDEFLNFIEPESNRALYCRIYGCPDQQIAAPHCSGSLKELNGTIASHHVLYHMGSRPTCGATSSAATKLVIHKYRENFPGIVYLDENGYGSARSYFHDVQRTIRDLSSLDRATWVRMLRDRNSSNTAFQVSTVECLRARPERQVIYRLVKSLRSPIDFLRRLREDFRDVNLRFIWPLDKRYDANHPISTADVDHALFHSESPEVLLELGLLTALRVFFDQVPTTVRETLAFTVLALAILRYEEEEAAVTLAYRPAFQPYCWAQCISNTKHRHMFEKLLSLNGYEYEPLISAPSALHSMKRVLEQLCTAWQKAYTSQLLSTDENEYRSFCNVLLRASDSLTQHYLGIAPIDLRPEQQSSPPTSDYVQVSKADGRSCYANALSTDHISPNGLPLHSGDTSDLAPNYQINLFQKDEASQQNRTIQQASFSGIHTSSQIAASQASSDLMYGPINTMTTSQSFFNTSQPYMPEAIAASFASNYADNNGLSEISQLPSSSITHDANSFPCPLCGELFVGTCSMSNFTRHFGTKHQDKKVKCPHDNCNYSARKDNIRKHWTKVHAALPLPAELQPTVRAPRQHRHKPYDRDASAVATVTGN